jgi:beta-lactamase regulating signal transducer with metallopeptidase domain
MILQWMAYAALCTALVGLAATCVDGIVGGWRRARRWVWLAAMLASTVVPLTLPLVARTVNTTPAQAVGASRDASASPPASSVNLDVVVLSMWAAASLVFATLLIVAHWRTTRALKTCRPGSIGGHAAFISENFGPAVVGVLRHTIVVPAWALALDDVEQRLVVAHEVEHARSGDPLVALAGVCAVVLMPWNVALWWQLSRLRLAIELDCDARVVARQRSDAIAYGQLLISVGERGRGTRHPVLAMSRSRSALAKRFDALLRRDAIQPRKVASLVALSVGTLATVAFIPAPNMSGIMREIRPAPAAPAAEQSMPVGALQRATFTTIAQAEPSAKTVKQPARRAGIVRRGATANFPDPSAIPPVRLVPPAAVRGPLDSVVVARATLPPFVRRAGGVIRAVPGGTGGGGGRGGFRAAPSTPIGGDSAGVVTRGRAVLVPRVDTIRPPT